MSVRGDIAAHRAPQVPLRVRAIEVARRAAVDPIARNSTLIMTSTMLNSGFGYLFWLLATHLYSAEQIGIASAAIAAGSLVAIISDLGLRSLVMQTLPTLRESRAWSAQVSAGIILSAASTALGAGIALVVFRAASPDLSRSFDNGWGLVFVVFSVTATLGMLLDGIATAERRGAQLVVRNTVAAVAKLVIIAGAGLLAARSEQDIVLATALGGVIAATFGIQWQLKHAHPGWTFSTARLGSTIRSIRGSIVGHHILSLSGYIPMFVLPLTVIARLGPRENAYMTLTWMVGSVFFMVSPSIGAMLFVQSKWEPDALRSAVHRSVALIATMMLPLALVFVVFGRFILSLFGAQYAEHGYPLLCLLALSSVPDAITNVFTGVLRAKDRVNEAAGLNLAMAVIAVVLTWVLLPPCGIVAVGIGWIVAQSAGSVYALFSGLRLRSRPS